MKKRGFTLVELLAVIIVLSIIALIATPMILGTIDDSKRGSFEQGIKNIVKAARTYQVREEIDNPIIECRYFSFDNDVSEITVRDGKTYYPLKNLSLKGTLPTQGEVKVCAEEITMEVSDGSYSGKYDNEQINIGKGDLADNDLSTPIIDIFNVSTTTDKIMIAISAHSPSVGGTIVNYYYKIDDGDYIKTTTPSYTFEKLTPGKEYIISVKVENKSGIANEKSKTVTTKKFGELTIEVADMGKWTSSKKVTIKSSTQGSTIEYNIIRYNEETSQEEEKGYTEYTEPFTLSTLATEEHPTIVVARYNDNGVYSEEKTYVITKIDPTAPTNTSPSVVVSTTKPTSEANVVIRQADSESGLNQATIEYGYSMSQNGTYTWQTSSKLIKLEAGKTYYVKTKVTNNAGLTTESVAQSYQVGSISTCSVNILTSGWATSKDVKIVGSQTGAELQYQIGTTDADKWINIENNGTLNITENTTVYCRLWDGTTENVGQGIINKIDKTSPELTLGAVTTTTNSASVSFAAVDNESQIKATTCKYSSTNGSYTTSGTISGNVCNLSGLSTGKTYYYQICTTNNAGNPSVCKTGSTNPVAMTKPGIGFTNTPSTIQNGYLKQQIATVSYVATGITSPRYFVKTSRAATSNVAVTKSCGADTNPAASCTTITSTTSLAANTWYEVSGNVNVTYSVASDSNATIYATTYDGTNFSGNISGTVAKIDRTSPELTLGTVITTTNSAIINFGATDSQSGIATTTCKYSSTSGSYTTDGTISGSTCTLNGLVTGTTYYYQICTTDKVNNTATCKEESTNPVEIAKPSIDFNNTPATIQNGYLKQQVATVSYVSTGVTSPRYFVKTSRAATSSVAVTNSCGTGTNPTANCTGITSTTSLAADTWYEVSGNVNVTYDVASDSNATIYATTYDGTNFSGNISGTVAKIDRTSPELTLRTATATTNSVVIPFSATDSQSGVGSTTCKYSSTDGSYTIDGTISDSTCNLNSLTSGTTYYYQICVTDKVNNTATCKPGSTNSIVMEKPSITSVNTPALPVNGYLKQQVNQVKYVSTGITNPRYFVKTTRAATSSVAVTKSCGTGTNPTISCTGITSTTSLAADTWYEVSGNVNVTYNSSASTTATLYATTYDGTNFSGNISSTIPKIDPNAPTLPTVSLKLNDSTGSTYSSNTWTNQNVYHIVNSSDSESGIAYYQYSHNGSTNWSNDIDSLGWSSSYNSDKSQLEYLIDWGGSWDFYVRAVDYVGNVSANSAKFTVKIDKSAPVLSDLSNPSGDNWSNKAFNVTIKVAESGSGIAKCQYKYAYDQYGACNDKWCDDNSSAVSDGVYTGSFTANRNTTSYFRCFDNAGNVSNEMSTPIKIDTTAPSSTVPTVTQSSSNARSLVVTSKQTDSGSGLNSGTLSYGYSTSSNGTYTWQSSNTFGSLTAGTTYYFKTKIKNNAGTETISNATAGKIAYTGIPAGTYSAGTNVTYADVDWQVISDNGNNVTLISKNNIGTGAYSKINSPGYSESLAKTIIDDWFNSNSVLVSDRNVLALVSDSSTGYYARLPRVNELSTNIPNGSETPFWTMSSSEYNNSQWMIVALPEGMSEKSSEGAGEYIGRLYYDDSTGQAERNVHSDLYGIFSEIKTHDYSILRPSAYVTLSVSSFTPIDGNIYYSKNKATTTRGDVFTICHASWGVTALFTIPDQTYAVGDDTCKKYSGYMYHSKWYNGGVGYRPVITVKEK